MSWISKLLKGKPEPDTICRFCGKGIYKDEDEDGVTFSVCDNSICMYEHRIDFLHQTIDELEDTLNKPNVFVNQIVEGIKQYRLDNDYAPGTLYIHPQLYHNLMNNPDFRALAYHKPNELGEFRCPHCKKTVWVVVKPVGKEIFKMFKGEEEDKNED